MQVQFEVQDVLRLKTVRYSGVCTIYRTAVGTDNFLRPVGVIHGCVMKYSSDTQINNHNSKVCRESQLRCSKSLISGDDSTLFEAVLFLMFYVKIHQPVAC